MQPDGNDKPCETNQRFGKLPKPKRLILAPESGFEHHLLAVVRPSLDERRRREQNRLASLRLHLSQVLIVQKVSRVDLVD